MLLKRQLTILLLLVLGASLCMTATARSFSTRNMSGESIPAVEEKYTSFETAAYIVREQEGYVAVFSSEAGELLEITAIPVSTLPKGDRALLARGITATNHRDLLLLLEDLNS